MTARLAELRRALEEITLIATCDRRVIAPSPLHFIAFLAETALRADDERAAADDDVPAVEGRKARLCANPEHGPHCCRGD